MKNTTIKMVLLGFIILFSISATPTMWPNWACLNQDAKQYCIMFKNLEGSNRLNEYSHLQNILDAAATNGYSKDDLIKVLGTPNKALSTQLQYWLQDDATKTTVTININETTKRVTGYGVSNQQLVVK